jgi:hypothetical protein
LLSDAFETTPTITYLLSSLTLEQRNAYRPKFFSAILTAAALNGAIFAEANGWKSCGVLIPPGKKVVNLSTLLPSGFLSVMWSIGLGGCYVRETFRNWCSTSLTELSKRMMYEGPANSKQPREKALQGQKEYYYVFFLGTGKDGRGQGLCSAIVRYYQTIAKRENLPIYMEAGTEYAWGLYKSLGFITVDEILVGKGKAAADGTLSKDGPGVKSWSMIWRPT